MCWGERFSIGANLVKELDAIISNFAASETLQSEAQNVCLRSQLLGVRGHNIKETEGGGRVYLAGEVLILALVLVAVVAVAAVAAV